MTNIETKAMSYGWEKEIEVIVEESTGAGVDF
jgi:hypothetical protein